MITKRQQTLDGEDKRLKALGSYNVLDTLPEKEYDAITRLASYICQTPIAMITFIDEDRQWIKSKFGMDIDQTARGDAFCNYTILGDDLLEVHNTLEDPRFRDNIYVTGQEGNIRFYAGAPLIDPDGHRLGSLCVVDTVPNKLSEEQRDALRTLAGQVMSNLQLRKQKQELEASLSIHEEFYSLFNASPEIHYIASLNGTIELINNAVTTILGYQPEQAIGKLLWDFVGGRGRDEFVPVIEKAVTTGEPFDIETQTKTINGDIKWLSWSAVHKNGKWYASGRDITYQKQIQAELEQLSQVASKMENGVIISDIDDKAIWANEAFEKITGLDFDDINGKQVNDILVSKAENDIVFEEYKKFIDKKLSYSKHVLIQKKDGEQVWLSVIHSVLYDKDGKPDRYLRLISDITVRKRSQEEMKLLSLVASSTTSGVVINDKDGKVEWVNDAFERITGYNINDAQHQHLGDILRGELTDVSIIEHSRELSQNKKSFEVDLLVYRKDGAPLWLTIINSVILNKEDAVDKYIEVIIDISAKKKVELELIIAKEEALQLSRAKDMFISVMSHEIRTPLNAVIGMSRLLVDEHPMDYQKENLNVLKFSAENLMGLINDVLDFTKIETGNVELEKADVDLRDLVHGIASSMRYRTDEKNIYLKENIDGTIPEIIIGDRTRLSQILLNLVSNAVKFTIKGGINIDLKVIEQTNKSVRIRFAVTDTGIGIANNKLNTIFESFKQANLDTTRKYGGTGLGLAISKRLIELHDSRINVDSVESEGSTFWFTITFNKKSNSINYNNDVDSTLDISVLVVDDNQINRLLINKILTKWGATTDFAENGVQAVEKIGSSTRYDVVLMDIHMPEMGGLEATQIIRSKTDPYFKQLPIIALTASMLNSQMSQISDSGMDDYILKPFEPKVLFDKLSRYQKQ